MQQYLDVVKQILDEGIDVYNERTKSVCKTIVGAQLKFDLKDGFPALTTRKLPFKNIVGELLGFFRGCTSAKEFRELGCGFWDVNANKTEAWLANPYRKGEDDCGRIYGAQWTDWTTVRITTSAEEAVRLGDAGWEYVGETDSTYKGGGNAIYRRSINQLENVVRTILTNPSDRRIIVSGWNIGEFDMMALLPCHIDYRFIPIEQTKTLHVVMSIRSLDFYLGTPANIASTALFLSIVARLTGYTAGQVIIQGTNVHLYGNSLDAARELITREPFPAPILLIGDDVKKIENMSDIEGCFKRINPEDFSLLGYKCHEALTVPMVA